MSFLYRKDKGRRRKNGRSEPVESPAWGVESGCLPSIFAKMVPVGPESGKNVLILCDETKPTKPEMKRLFTPLYWSVAVPLVALVLWSAIGSLSKAMFAAVMLLPGVLFFKYFVRDISYKNRRLGIIHTIYFVAIVMLIEYLSIFFVYFNVEYPFDAPPPPAIVTNPLFIWLLLGALLSVEYLLRSKLGAGEPRREKFITFTSDRRRLTLETGTILYIESRDDEVTVATLDGTHHPTRMKISQWEAALDDRFVRVHRSFIVSRLHISRLDAHTVWLGEMPIEISRKYRERVTAL